MEEQEKELLTPDEMATMMGVTRQTLRLWRRSGILPYIKIKNTIRYSREDVMKCIDEFRRHDMPESK